MMQGYKTTGGESRVREIASVAVSGMTATAAGEATAADNSAFLQILRENYGQLRELFRRCLDVELTWHCPHQPQQQSQKPQLQPKQCSGPLCEPRPELGLPYRHFWVREEGIQMLLSALSALRTTQQEIDAFFRVAPPSDQGGSLCRVDVIGNAMGAQWAVGLLQASPDFDETHVADVHVAQTSTTRTSPIAVGIELCGPQSGVQSAKRHLEQWIRALKVQVVQYTGVPDSRVRKRAVVLHRALQAAADSRTVVGQDAGLCRDANAGSTGGPTALAIVFAQRVERRSQVFTMRVAASGELATHAEQYVTELTHALTTSRMRPSTESAPETLQWVAQQTVPTINRAATLAAPAPASPPAAGKNTHLAHVVGQAAPRSGSPSETSEIWEDAQEESASLSSGSQYGDPVAPCPAVPFSPLQQTNPSEQSHSQVDWRPNPPSTKPTDAETAESALSVSDEKESTTHVRRLMSAAKDGGGDDDDFGGGPSPATSKQSGTAGSTEPIEPPFESKSPTVAFGGAQSSHAAARATRQATTSTASNDARTRGGHSDGCSAGTDAKPESGAIPAKAIVDSQPSVVWSCRTDLPIGHPDELTKDPVWSPYNEAQSREYEALYQTWLADRTQTVESDEFQAGSMPYAFKVRFDPSGVHVQVSLKPGRGWRTRRLLREQL